MNSQYRISYEPQPGRSMVYCLEKKHKLFGLIPYWQYVANSWFASYNEVYDFYQQVKKFNDKPKFIYLE